MADNSFKTSVETLLNGMEGFINSKTVVGDPIHIGETIILPLVDVSFGVAAGAFSQPQKNNGGGGMGAKLTPSCVLVINGDKIKLVNIKNQDGITKVLDFVPDIVDKIAFSVKGDKYPEGPEKEEAKEKLSEMINESVEVVEE
ncbi:MAG: GerW family sporulation protein [Eubacterium sp.]|nr:GerW family sporulation protein [Eubacterium sp.]